MVVILAPLDLIMVLEPPGIPPGYTDGLVLTIFRDNVGMYVNIYIYLNMRVYV